jgi:hypothetical protein
VRDMRMRAVAGLVGAAMLAACVSPITHPVPGGPAVERDDFRFVAPTGWQVQASTEVSFGSSRRVVYLANQPLHDDCAPGVSGIICHAPIDGELRPGGMLVTWVISSCVAGGCELPAATLIAIGNRQGVMVPMSSGCEGTGSTERAAYYVTVSPQRIDILVTCARGPSDATRSAFLGFLDAIRWRIP